VARLPRITKIYTKTGDDGTTALGGGSRVKKYHARIEAYGTVDELNSQIGLALASGLTPDLADELLRVQNELFHLGSDLCVPEEDKERMPVPQTEARHIEALEAMLDSRTAEVGPLENFILPGGSVGAAHLHVARTVCRRAERILVALSEKERVGAYVVKYLNRLSDALFVAARYENKCKGFEDVYWKSRG
jgi:cob(I)alamin adenosyltransferase